MVQGFIDGIGNMIGRVGTAAKNIGNKIKSFLHFSRPDEGPLRDYETWMPDMVEGLSKTLNANAPKLYEASKELASKVAKGLDMSNMIDGMSYKINTDFVSSVPNLLGSTISKDIQLNNVMTEFLGDILANNEKNVNITIPLTLNVGNKKLGQILLEDLRDMKRQTGNGLEALVGG